MVPGEHSSTLDGRRFRGSRTPRRLRVGAGRLPGPNKRTVLGLLAVAVGVAAATSRDGLVVAVPLLVAGWYLLGRPLARADPPR